MATTDESDFYFVLVFGFLLLLYSILFFVLDTEYRNNFQSGGHNSYGNDSYADEQDDKVAVHIQSAKDQFNQIAIKLENLRVRKYLIQKDCIIESVYN